MAAAVRWSPTVPGLPLSSSTSKKCISFLGPVPYWRDADQSRRVHVCQGAPGWALVLRARQTPARTCPPGRRKDILTVVPRGPKMRERTCESAMRVSKTARRAGARMGCSLKGRRVPFLLSATFIAYGRHTHVCAHVFCTGIPLPEYGPGRSPCFQYCAVYHHAGYARMPLPNCPAQYRQHTRSRPHPGRQSLVTDWRPSKRTRVRRQTLRTRHAPMSRGARASPARTEGGESSGFAGPAPRNAQNT